MPNYETNLEKQYNHFKEKYPDAILLFRVGDFYETFGTDAIATASALGITLTKRHNGTAEIELAGFPYHALDNYLPKLVRAGYRVAVIDEIESPKPELPNYKESNEVSMNKISILSPLGLQNMLFKILNATSFIKKDPPRDYGYPPRNYSRMNWAIFEYLGTSDYPLTKIKEEGKGIFETIQYFNSDNEVSDDVLRDLFDSGALLNESGMLLMSHNQDTRFYKQLNKREQMYFLSLRGAKFPSRYFSNHRANFKPLIKSAIISNEKIPPNVMADNYDLLPYFAMVKYAKTFKTSNENNTPYTNTHN